MKNLLLSFFLFFGILFSLPVITFNANSQTGISFSNYQLAVTSCVSMNQHIRVSVTINGNSCNKNVRLTINMFKNNVLVETVSFNNENTGNSFFYYINPQYVDNVVVSIAGNNGNCNINAIAFTCAGTVLPIELLSFDAIPNNNEVDLSWVTGSEKNNDFFTVERTVDGVDFEKVGEVAGQGNSNTITNYTFTDSRPKNGVSYYRLTQTDFNGEFEYFAVKSVNIQKDEFVSSVYPNPAVLNKTTVFVEQTDSNVTLNVRNMLGQLLFTKEVDSKSKDVYEEIELTEAGQIFLVEIVKNNSIIARHKVLKR